MASMRTNRTRINPAFIFSSMPTFIECHIVHIFARLEAFTLSFASRNIRDILDCGFSFCNHLVVSMQLANASYLSRHLFNIFWSCR